MTDFHCESWGQRGECAGGMGGVLMKNRHVSSSFVGVVYIDICKVVYQNLTVLLRHVFISW